LRTGSSIVGLEIFLNLLWKPNLYKSYLLFCICSERNDVLFAGFKTSGIPGYCLRSRL
jgi:hypothetical protein